MTFRRPGLLCSGLWGMPCWGAVALPLNSYVTSRTLPLLQTNRSGQLPEIQRKGPGHPGLPDRKLLPLQAGLSYPRGRRRGKDSLHKLGLRMKDGDKGVKERRKREWEKRVGMPQVKVLSGCLRCCEFSAKIALSG